LKFENLNLIAPILKAVDSEGYTMPTPIQEKAIPVILEGKDLVGCAQTGTGKTAAFAIPLLQILYQVQRDDRTGNVKESRTIRALILTPTRELAIQIGDSFAAYGRYTGIKHTVIYGGVSQGPQTNALKAGVDILVSTPGRLLDLINQKYISLNHINILVLDEADRMLDMGFAHDMKKILKQLPATRQTLLFSATMPPEITKLVNTILTKPVKVEVTPVSSTVDTIEQAVYFVDRKDKKSLLIQLLRNSSIDSALVFTRTKHGADKVVKDLAKAKIIAQAIHGNKSQGARQLALNNFKLKRTRVLVATDIAARGIDVHELSHVINFDLPNIPETYVHRIGRTGRAGLGGTAVSFCDSDEKEYLRDIQKLICKKIPVIEDQPFVLSVAGE
jgi:ATP-dependent RNA helicase RhlE